jgi:hypothetical protein
MVLMARWVREREGHALRIGMHGACMICVGRMEWACMVLKHYVNGLLTYR